MLAGVLAFAALLAFSLRNPPGLSWDEAYYYPAFLDVAAWQGEFVCDTGAPLTREGIARGWERVHELPPVIKWLGALAILPEPDGPGTLAWMRLVPALAFGLSTALVFSLARRLAGSRAGALAAVLFALHPHLVGNAQLAVAETVFGAVTLLAARAALGDMSGWRGRLALAAWVGAGLATKANGLVLAAAIVAWLLASRGLARGRALAPRRAHWAAAAAVAVAAPILALAVWPWMWHDTAARLAEYARFVTEHRFYGVWYMGRLNDPDTSPVPWHYVPVMLAATAPVAWLGAVGFGWGWVAWVAAGRRRLPRAWTLMAALALAPLAAACLPTTPRYDAIRLFQPALGPMVVLAAAAVAARRRVRRRAPVWRLAIAALGGAIVLEAYGFAAAPHPLSFYNVPTLLAGSRADVFPLERTYWGEAIDPTVVADLNTMLPPGARVKTLALHAESFAILQRWGVLRRDITFDGEPPYDAHIVQNRRGFWRNAEWSIHSSREPLRSWHRTLPKAEPLVWLHDGRPPGG